jgi:hypothetical protein
MNRYKHTETGEIKTHREWQNELGISFHADRPPEFLQPYRPPAPQPQSVSLPDRQQQALQQINHHYQQQAEQQIGQYPDFEIQTWQDQEREAITYQAWVNAGSTGNAPLTPVLSAIVTARGIGLVDLVTRVIANATAWRQLAPALAGQRQALADQIMAATTAERVDTIINAMLQPPESAVA